MHITNHPICRLFSFLGCCLLCLSLLAGCGSSATSNTSSSPTVARTSTSGGATTATTGHTPPPVAVTPGATNPVVTPTLPVAQTSCPTIGTARDAVMPPLVLGPHQNIVYIVNEYQGNLAIATLKRYDVTTGVKTEIVKMPSVFISFAQVSTDGQWILFVDSTNNRLMMVRIDGQELQTLLCSTLGSLGDIGTTQWSTNQQLVAFSGNSTKDASSNVYLLNIHSGVLRRLVHQTLSISPVIDGYALETWLDATHLYVRAQGQAIPGGNLSLLDITRGNDQNSTNIQQLFPVAPQPSPSCWDNDSSYDGTQLFISTCMSNGTGSIVVEPATGGTPHSIYSNTTFAITAVRSISRTTLLFLVNNSTGDTSHNGLWEIHTDGTGLTRLTTDNPNLSSAFNTFTQYPWSNVSRDGSMYALTMSSGHQRSPVAYMLSFGTLNGGTPSTFASIADGTQLSIVGWTTM